MTTRIVPKRSINIRGHVTSVSIEHSFWEALHEIAATRNVSASKLIEDIDRGNPGNLSSAIREFVLSVYRSEVT